MQNYQKTYFIGMGYDLKDIDQNNLQSELLGEKANDVHHLKLGCSLKRQDYPVERLIMLTREEHVKYGDKKQWYDYLFWMHILKMAERNVEIVFTNFPEQIVPMWSEYFTLLDFWANVKEGGYNVSVHEKDNGVATCLFVGERKVFSSFEQTKLESFKTLVF